MDLEKWKFVEMCPMTYSFSKYLWVPTNKPNTEYLEMDTQKSWSAESLVKKIEN